MIWEAIQRNTQLVIASIPWTNSGHLILRLESSWVEEIGAFWTSLNITTSFFWNQFVRDTTRNGRHEAAQSGEKRG